MFIMERDFDYETSNIGYNYQYTEQDGGGIKCKNHIICESVLPKHWFEQKGHYLCLNCDMMFGTWSSWSNAHAGKGTLEISHNVECPICLEMKTCISQPRCDHSVCMNCFKRCYFGDETGKGKPIFPYSDIEDEYYEDPCNPKWESDYPLINTYNEEYNIWDHELTNKYHNEEYLRKCPLCRK